MRVERLPRGKRETRGTPRLPVSQPSGYPRALLHPHGRGEYLDPTVCSRRTQGVRENCLWTDRPRTSPLPRLRRRHASSWLLRAWDGRVARQDHVATGFAHAVLGMRRDPCGAAVVSRTVSADEHAVFGAHRPSVGVGETWRRLLEGAGRSLRTLRRWAKRWRWRALQTVPWLASLVFEANPQSAPPRYSANEAPFDPRRAVAEELRWLDALEGQRARNEIDGEVRGWAWANLHLGRRTTWF